MYDHKFQNKSGYPTFWNSLKDGVVLKDDHCDVPEVRNQTVVDPLTGRVLELTGESQ